MRLSRSELQRLLAHQVGGFRQSRPRASHAGTNRIVGTRVRLKPELLPPATGPVEFCCPLPPREVSQNGRPAHWGERNRDTQDYHKRVADAVHAAGVSGSYDRARISLLFLVPDRRRRDVLNYVGSFKSGIDCLVSEGILPDDDAAHLQVGRLVLRPVRAGETPGVRVRLEAVEEES